MSMTLCEMIESVKKEGGYWGKDGRWMKLDRKALLKKIMGEPEPLIEGRRESLRRRKRESI